MEIDVGGRDTSDLSFLCCLALADLAQAKGDARKAEYYISLAYAAMDRQAHAGEAMPQYGQDLHPAHAA
jgi:hypothetical protein